MTKKRKARFTKGEVLLYSMAFISLFGVVVLKIFFSAGITNLNMNIEIQKQQIENQEKTNESLTMKVNELTAYDTVKDVVSDMGLAYNNDSIVIIDD
jgi:cell division protein FtsL